MGVNISDEIGEISAFLTNRIDEDDARAIGLTTTLRSDLAEQKRLRAQGKHDHENAVGRREYLAQLTAGNLSRFRPEAHEPEERERQVTSLAAMKSMAWRYRAHDDWHRTWAID